VNLRTPTPRSIVNLLCIVVLGLAAGVASGCDDASELAPPPDASSSDGAIVLVDAATVDGTIAPGLDWQAASAASLQGAHIARAGWLPGQYAYRIASGALWRFTPNASPTSAPWAADSVDRAANDWVIVST